MFITITNTHLWYPLWNHINLHHSSPVEEEEEEEKEEEEEERRRFMQGI